MTPGDDQVFVTLDQGGHASRALAFDPAGRRVASAFVTVGTHRNALGHVEHDAAELLSTLRTAVGELARQVPPARWAAAGLATQRSTIACWDRLTGAPLAPAISWQDRRNADWLRGFTSRATWIHELTGLPLSPHYGASKLRWCLDYVPAVRAARDAGRLCMGPLASFLLHGLLEERPSVADPANASRTQLWSPAGGDWSDDLLNLFGVPRGVLPACVPTQHGFGTLMLDGCRIPLTVCTGDQAAAPFASGALDPAAAYVNVGTGAFILRPTPGPVQALPLLTGVLRSDGSRTDFAIEGTVNGAGSALEWLAAEEGIATDRLLATLEGAVPAGDPLFFLNGIGGLGSPFWIPDFPSRFVGEGDLRARARAVLESVAFLLRANLDEISRHADLPARLVVSGGLSPAGGLCRLLANLTRVPVVRLTDAEATARGLAWLVAGKGASWDSPHERLEPGIDQELLARYVRWLKLMESAGS
jgi:glycerol kinase